MPRTGRYVNKEEVDIVKQALANLEALRDPETHVIPTESIVAEVQRIMWFDADEEKRRKAERIVRNQSKPGKTEPKGQLKLPSFEAYAYEPDQLISDGEGNTVERDKATGRVLEASLQRKEENLEKARIARDRAAAEVDLHAEWVADQAAIGRPANQLTFGNWGREKGYWSAEPVEDEADDDDDDDE